MAIGIIRLDQFSEGGMVKSKGPTKQEMMNMQRHQEKVIRKLDREMPFSNGKLTFTK